MKKKNDIKLTLISFLSYSFIGSLVVITGIVMNQIAKSFNYPITKISMIFTFLNLGILIGIIINSWIIKKVSIKKQIILSFLLLINSTILLFICKNIIIFSAIIFIYGLVSGLTMSIGTFLITVKYIEKERTPMLLLTDSFFSISGTIFPLISAYILKKEFSWHYIYMIISVIYMIIFLITLNTTFPLYVVHKKNEIKKKKYKKTTIILYFIAFLYILGQLTFISWIPIYVNKYINLNIIQSGNIISEFWTSYMIGMWFFSIIIKFFNFKKLIANLMLISTILIYLFNHTYHYQLLQYIIITLGFFSSAIYSSIVTLASLEMNPPSQKIINFTLISGTIGTLLTFLISSPIVKIYDEKYALYMANIIYFIVLNLFIMFIYFKKKK
ncbi:MFS transporter TsgA [Buchnera aphidicola (Mollitrichosiphum nigrofasciatum)]|uniref:MFS transporter TsgA n=1 Tax=Buchnera aphidicola TaxID=9 RepID=UPI0031B86CF0